MAILVCGGAGYIGSHINKLLAQNGFQTVTFDNLVYGHRESVKWGDFIQGDLNSLDNLESVFRQYPIDAVFHFAAYAYVGESVREPEKYYQNNVANTLNLLRVMRKHGCNRIIFSSTCATYGEPEKTPITEEQPQKPINPYGASKLMVERIFKDYSVAYGLKFVVFRYFNAAGADPDGEIGESHNPETHIIPLALKSALKGDLLQLFGDNYDTKDGLQSNEFNTGSILTKSDGSVIFGGLYGVNWVRQAAKEDQNSLPRVMLTQLFIGEEEILVGHEYDNNVILTQALNESNKISLKNKQNTFTIKFAAGNYNQGERLQFMYWMEGRDHDWRNGDALLHGVKFRDLSSGTYTLHVKAVSADCAVSNQERKLEIYIERPWWLTWWMLSVYVLIAIVILIIWRYGYKKLKNYMTRKRTVVDELKRQREEIKLTSDELRQPMARMTTIIGNLAEKENDLEGREQLNSLHFQMLQVITRISEMQTILENPEAKAESTAKDRLELNDQGEVSLPSIATSELTATIQPLRLDKKTQKFNVVFIDSNKDFNNFMNAHLREVYDFHIYDDIRLAIPDIESMKADLVICKQDMKHMTGSELCNQLKSNPRTQQIKFVLMTDTVLTQEMMSDMNITLAADDYIAKPFNVQEAVMRFNKLMGLGPVEMEQNTIEGRETRMLEGRNASMTTATMVYEDIPHATDTAKSSVEETEDVSQQTVTESTPEKQGGVLAQQFYGEDETIGNYSMSNLMDRQLMRNVEQYVLQNMSRGQISLEEMASAMGMGRVPFFHKIRNITAKTPAEVVRDIRLKHACVLLTKTNINMSELAINIGFSTAENFINIFKDKYGMTPLEYRLKNKQ